MRELNVYFFLSNVAVVWLAHPPAISARSTSVLTEIFRGFPWAIEANYGRDPSHNLRIIWN
jgi:hypothetical protein